MSKEPHTPESVEETAWRLEQLAAGLRKSAGEMRRRRIPRLLVNFEKCRIKSLNWAETWGATLDRAIRESADGISTNQQE
jgi:hypothetical protein